MTDYRDPSGKFSARPPAAAPLFTPDSGKAASLVRWEAQRERNKKMLIEHAAVKLGVNVSDLTYEAALRAVLLSPLFGKAAEGSVAGIKLALMVLDEMPENSEAKVVQDQRKIQVNVFNLTDRDTAERYIEGLRVAGEDSVADIVEAQLDDGNGPWKVKVPIG